MKQSQTEQIYQHLQSGRTITPIEALNKYGCFRLGGRIHELRKEGHQIVTIPTTQNGKTFATYKLVLNG